MEEITSENALQILKNLHDDVQIIKSELNKYKGFIGAVWFIFSCAGIFLSSWKFLHKG